MLLNIALGALMVTQLPIGTDAKRVSVLKRGEILRQFVSGGRSRFGGQYMCLTVLRADGVVIVKTNRSSSSKRLDRKSFSQIMAALAKLDTKRLFSQRRTDPIPPSASDMSGIYFEFKKKGTIQRWNNIKWHRPPDEPFFDVLDAVRKEVLPDE